MQCLLVNSIDCLHCGS